MTLVLPLDQIQDFGTKDRVYSCDKCDARTVIKVMEDVGGGYLRIKSCMKHFPYVSQSTS
jgi:hypothetical protein